MTEANIKLAPDGPPAPKRRGPRNKFINVERMCLKHPGEWVVVSGYLTASIAAVIRAGKIKAIDPDEFDVEIRRSNDGKTYDLYLRYTGPVIER